MCNVIAIASARTTTRSTRSRVVHAVRIEEAKQLIETETENIDDVSLKVGYEDPTFFRRLFKRKTGLTPAAYRRKYSGILSAGP